MNPKRTGIVIPVVAAAVFAGIIALVLHAVNDVEGTDTATILPTAQVEASSSLEEQGVSAADTNKGKKSKGQPAIEEPKVNEALQARLEGTASATGMLTCVSFYDLTSGETASYLGDQRIASASMIKLLVAYAFLEQVQEGKQSLDAYYTLTSDDLVGGSGTLIGLGAGARITYRDALMRMIDASDNVGANILIDAVGIDAVNETADGLGLAGTRLNRRMMDEQAMAAGIENYTCAADLAQLLQMVYDGTFVDEASSALMLQALEQQEDEDGILSGLPAGTVFAHKTGALMTVHHDGGIVEGDHPYVLVVLCGGEGFYEGGALRAMADVARLVDDEIAGRR